jgi:hypothetical protein
MAKAKKVKKNNREHISEDFFQKHLLKMEKKLAESFQKLKKDFSRKADLTTLRKDSHDLLLLLREANFLEKECKKLKKAI